MGILSIDRIDNSDCTVITESCKRGTIHQYRKKLHGITLQWGDFVVEENGQTEQQITGDTDLGGCSQRCVFCISPGEYKTLNAQEIEQQFRIPRDHVRKDIACGWAGALVGEGENADDPMAVAEAIEAISRWDDLPRSFLVSTTGKDCHDFIPRMAEAAKKLRPGVLKLQVSITSVDPVKRRQLMPDSVPLHVILPFIKHFALQTNTKVKGAFPQMAGVNDSAAELEGIVQLVQENPWIIPKISANNPIPGRKFRAPAMADQEKFVADLAACGVPAQLFIADIGTYAMNCGTVTALQSTTTRSSLKVLENRDQ